MLLIINSLRIADKIYKDNLLYNNIVLLGELQYSYAEVIVSGKRVYCYAVWLQNLC